MRIIGKVVEIGILAIALPALLAAAAVSPDDAVVNIGKWTAKLGLRDPPSWLAQLMIDHRIVGTTLMVCLLLAVFRLGTPAARALPALLLRARRMGAEWIAPTAEYEPKWLVPSAARREFQDQDIRVQERQRLERSVAATANVEMLRHRLRQAARKEKRGPRGDPSSGPPPSPELAALREDFGAAADEEHAAAVWHHIYVEADIRALIGKLETGALIAKGFTSATLIPGTCVDIPKEQWSFLEIDFDKDEASGRGITYYYVQIRISTRVANPSHARQP